MKICIGAVILTLVSACTAAPTQTGDTADWEYGSYAGRPVKSGPGM